MFTLLKILLPPFVPCKKPAQTALKFLFYHPETYLIIPS